MITLYKSDKKTIVSLYKETATNDPHVVAVDTCSLTIEKEKVTFSLKYIDKTRKTTKRLSSRRIAALLEVASYDEAVAKLYKMYKSL